MISATTLLVVAAISADAHLAINSVYRNLQEVGVPAASKVLLPEPVMADGLTPAQQLDALKGVVGKDIPLDEFTRNSPVSPNVLRLRDISGGLPESPLRGMDAYFVAYGRLAQFNNRAALDKLLGSNSDQGKGKSLSEEDLMARNIRLQGDDATRQSLGHAMFNLLDRVDLSVTGHSCWSQTESSIVLAGHVDERFRDDKEFPNAWRALKKDGNGLKPVGEAFPYSPAGYYLKITQIQTAKDALFIEGHVIFAEPQGWFDGANLLRSKLPPVVQKMVRDFRRELPKLAAPQPPGPK